MTKMLTLALAAPLLAAPMLAACATVTPPAPGEVAGGGTCSDASLQQFVGQPATEQLGAQILAASGAKTFQWVPAGSMVTMDFRADRVRVSLDEQNRVQRLSCG